MKPWLVACVTFGLLGLAAGAAHAQYYVQTYAYPYVTYYTPPPTTYAPAPSFFNQGAYYYATVPDNRGFVGNSFQFYGQGSASSFRLTTSAYGTQALGYETTPTGSPILFVQPGPYFYTAAQEYTPSYYGFYDTPRFFRY